MAISDTPFYSVDQIIRARAFRNARCYAPDSVTATLLPVATTAQLALVIDVDALEQSALAKIDKVMLLALDALGRAGVHVAVVAQLHRDRAAAVRRSITGAYPTVLAPNVYALAQLRSQLPDVRCFVLSDNPELFVALRDDDRGIALGRPELAGPNIAVSGDTAVRATLWWLLEERARSSAS